ncbi:MAG: LytTR family DNA-binding domain-containing protein [Saprospiraceae bacterium]
MNTQPISSRTSKVIPLTAGRRLNILRRNEDIIENDLSASKEFFAIATKGKIEMISFSEIVFVKSESNYTRFHLKDNGMVFAAKTLKEVSRLLEKAGFIRVHKSFILHPSIVRQYDIAHGILLLRSGEQIPVSRSNKKMVAEKLLTCSC